jgi:hypothetical protein
LLASSLVISLHNPLFLCTRSANANANTWGARYLLCVVVASDVQDEEIDKWSEASVLVWPSQDSGSHSSDNRSQDSAQSSSFMYMATDEGLIRYLADDDVPMATDGDNISIHSTEEMEKYESLHQREFGNTHVYDVNLLERVGMDEELPLILWTIGWGKHYGGDRTTRATDG